MLEMTIIRLVAPKVTQHTIEELDAMHRREIEAIQSGKIRFHQLADRAIHLALAAQTENTFLLRYGKHSRPGRVDRFSVLSDATRSFGKVYKDHKELIDTLKKGNSASAESIMSRHIERGKRESIKISSQTR